MRYAFLFLAFLVVAGTVHAQVGVSVGFNVQSQPVWGPVGYDRVDYYYFPDIEAYYNVPQHMYYYNDGGRWIGRSHLPQRYHNFDLYGSYKVVINDPKPYLNHARYRDQYASFRGRHDQAVIRDSHDSRYFGIKGHPQHNAWVRQQHHGSSHANGRRNGHIAGRNNGGAGRSDRAGH
jgi:hypothetical protein